MAEKPQAEAKRPYTVTAAAVRQRREAPLRHGLFAGSDALRSRGRRVRRLIRRMYAVMHWLQPSDEPTCRAWAELEIVATVVFVELAQAGVVSEAGEAKRLLAEYRQLRSAQLAYSRELGMT